MTDLLDSWTQQVILNDAVITERRMELHIQPRPSWLPEKIWRRVLARLLVLNEYR